MRTYKSRQQEFIEEQAVAAYDRAKGTTTAPGAPALNYRREKRVAKLPKGLQGKSI